MLEGHVNEGLRSDGSTYHITVPPKKATYTWSCVSCGAKGEEVDDEDINHHNWLEHCSQCPAAFGGPPHRPRHV